MDSPRIYIGYEPRQHIAFEVLKFSLETNSSIPLDIYPLHLEQLSRDIGFERPHDPRQSTEFTYTRFLVPFLCNYQGRALYMDCDMICIGDISEIYSMDLSNYSLRVVKQDHVVDQSTKMGGQVQSAYPRKNWSSLMLLNCAELTSWSFNAVREQSGKWLHRFEPIPDERIGELPAEWNVLDRLDEQTKLIHYTSGGPWLRGCENHPYRDLWFEYLSRMSHSVNPADRSIIVS